MNVGKCMDGSLLCNYQGSLCPSWYVGHQKGGANEEGGSRACTVNRVKKL